jgi:hypothetical protein
MRLFGCHPDKRPYNCDQYVIGRLFFLFQESTVPYRPFFRGRDHLSAFFYFSIDNFLAFVR